MLSRDVRGARPAVRARLHAAEEQLKLLTLAGLGGDRPAQEALLQAVQPLLRTFFRSRMRDPVEAEDLVQEALVAVHERRSSYEPKRPFMPWLFAIARYKLVDYLRHAYRHQPSDGLEGLVLVESFESRSHARLDIERLLDTLPAKQAAAIRATRLRGMSIAEAAQGAGLGESDIKVSVHRGMKALRAQVSAQFA